jgi:MGT family glycosyltransferase
MEIMFASTPATGHVLPGLPIASELVRRGHRVRWYTAARFAETVESTGAVHVPMDQGTDWGTDVIDDAIEGLRDKSGIAKLRWEIRAIFLDTIPGYLADLDRAYSERPFSTIVFENAFFAGAFFAARHHVPAVAYGVIPLTLSSRDTAPFGLGLLPSASPAGRLRNRLLDWAVHNLVFGDLQRLADRLHRQADLGPIPTFFLDLVAERSHAFLQGTVAEFEYPRSDLPDHVEFVGPFLPPSTRDSRDLPEWWPDLHEDRPVILVTQGTVATDLSALVRPTIEAFSDSEHLVVASIGDHDDASLTNIPANVRVERYIPFDRLLPHVDVMVTNGGYGGVHFALANGVPLVVAGRTEDKLEVARRIEWSGAGLRLKRDRPRASEVRHAVEQMLASASHRERARSIQTGIARSRSARTAADIIERQAPVAAV